MRLLCRLGLVATFASLAFASQAEGKKKIEKAADLPVYTYAISGSVEDTIKDPAKFASFAREFRRHTTSTLDDFDIADKATLRQLVGSLALLDILEQRDADARNELARLKGLQDKPADKLMSGLQSEAVLTARKQVPDTASDAYRRAVGARIAAMLESYPYEVVQNDVRELKASAEIASEGLALGYPHEVLQPIVARTGALSSEFAPAIISARYRLTVALPLKGTFVATYSDYLARHKVDKNDIWAARDVALPIGKGYAPVPIAVWDSGVDLSLYKDSLALDGGHTALIAFDKYSRPTQGNLYPLPADVLARMPLMVSRTKGFADLQSNVDSPEASEVKQYLSSLQPEQYKTAIEELQMIGNYSHGTHVAGIALAGNPYARLVTARLEYGYTLMPDPCPSKELSLRDAAATQAFVDYMKKTGVRVVNMSWGGDVKSIESDLEVCGIGKTVDERHAMAREYFDMSRDALKKAFASAPNILFVAAAGNENADSTFAESIPADIALPNVVAVGAVDLAGDEASFTSYGPTVKVHANGYQVVSNIPGGARVAESGTSMAAPQVTNLAAKMLAVNPHLTPPELVSIIVSTADRSADGRRTLIDPKKAVATAASRKAA